MTERQALLGAGVAHVALFAALSVGWSMMERPQLIEEAVPVEFVDIAPETRVTERPRESMAAAPQEVVEPPPAPPEPAPPEPAPPEPDAVPEPAAKPAPPPKPAPKPVAKPAAPRERLDATELTDLIDKALPKAPKKVRDPSDFAKSIETSIPKTAKLDARATASLSAAIYAQIRPCWNPPMGGSDVAAMTVKVSIQLARDGTNIGRPSVIGQTGVSSGNTAYAKAFADAAVRAVLRCSPLELPAAQYDVWKSFDLNFTPSGLT